jgi:hypothetical protein
VGGDIYRTDEKQNSLRKRQKTNNTGASQRVEGISKINEENKKKI